MGKAGQVSNTGGGYNDFIAEKKGYRFVEQRAYLLVSSTTHVETTV